MQIRPTGFRILPTGVKNLLIINALIYLAQITFDSALDNFITNYFALHSVFSEYFYLHQLITHMFLHGSFSHIFFNMFALWMFGNILENYYGTKKFIVFYLMCGIGAALFHLGYLSYQQYPIYEQLQNYYNISSATEYEIVKQNVNRLFNQPTVGASGAVFGCLAAFGYLFPNALIYIYFLVPIKAKWFVLIYMAIELFYVAQNTPGDNIARFAHIGGAIVGFLLIYFQKRGIRLF